jgi:Ca-activated chloride channel family protein
MTQFTSFVAVEEMTITEGGQPKTVQVPVEMPDGVSREGVFGKDEETRQYAPASVGLQYNAQALAKSANAPTGYVSSGSGAGYGIGGGGYRSAEVSTDSVSQPTVPAKTDAKKLRPEFKISPSLQQVQQCMRILAVSSRAPAKKGGEVGCATDKDGKVLVQLQLTDKSPETVKQLQAAGFEVVSDPRSSATVAIGKVSALKLDDVAKLDAVRYVSSLEGSQNGAPAVSKGGKR